jgi:hypothetical protein
MRRSVPSHQAHAVRVEGGRTIAPLTSALRLREHWRIAVGALLVALLSASLIGEARQRPPILTADESQWITSGYVAWKLLRQRAPPARWERAFDERELSDWGNKNPPLGKYWIGLAVTPHVQVDSDVRYHWAFFRPPGSPGPRNNAPPPAMLVAARTAIAVSGALALAACYLVALELLGASLWACLAPLSLFLVPSFQFHATRVFTDMPELALLLLGTHSLLAYARTSRFAWLAAALVCGGLACAVKFTAGAFCVAMLLYVGQRSLRRRELRWALPAAVAVPVFCFVAVNPYLYDAPLAKTVQLVRDWQSSKALQREHPVVAHQAVHGWNRGLELVSLRGALAPTSAPFPRSDASEAVWRLTPLLLGLSSLALAALWLGGLRPSLRRPAGRLWPLLGAFVGGSALEAILADRWTWFGGLCGLGLASLVVELGGRRGSVLRPFCCVLLATWLFTALWLPFDWSRYYLPVLVPMSCVYAHGAAALASRFDWRTREVGEGLDAATRRACTALGLAFALVSGCVLLAALTPPLLAP